MTRIRTRRIQPLASIRFGWAILRMIIGKA